jgi:hypothetical protein
MPRFTILPTDHTHSSAEIVALDAGAVLNVVGQLRCRDADVLEDGKYAFSLHLGASGMWSIYQRADSGVSRDISAFG